ncbi:MAG: FTR1 family iron permease [Candidatus Asgardarchaeia archaeon]
MLGQFIIAFREAFEAALIISVILAYLIKTGRKELTSYVWIGVFVAVITSLSLGVLLWSFYGALSEINRVLFEALSAYIAVIILTFMIYWMTLKGKTIKREIEHRIELAITKGTIIGLVITSFIIVFREGIELVLFMTPFLISDTFGTVVGTVLGISVSFVFSYIVFIAGVKLNIEKIFFFTSILLVLIAGGLLGYGTHEFVEYLEIVGINLGWLAESAYNLNIPNDSLFHHKGIIGSIFAVMIGYTVNAEWIRVFLHVAYLLIMFPLLFFAKNKKKKP